MKLSATRLPMLVALAVLSCSAGWSLMRLWPRLVGQRPDVPWLAAVTMVALAVTLLVWTLITRARLHPEPGKPRMHPLVAARTVALAMAASRVGAMTGGFYLGFLVVAIAARNTPSGLQRLWVAGVVVLASLATTCVGVWLERICQVPKPPTDAALAGQRN